MKTFMRCILIGICLVGLQFGGVCLPNPTTNQTLLRWDADMDRIEVISETGQQVRTFNVSGLTQKVVDMSHMQPGIYFIRFLSGSFIVATKKLIKQ